MPEKERNALAELESELRFTLTDIRGECCEASYEAVVKAQRIVAELEKLNISLIPQDCYGCGVLKTLAECREIAEEGVYNA